MSFPATVIWKLLDQIDTLDAVVNAMEQLYDKSSTAAIQDDVTAVIVDMIAHGIVGEH